MLSSSPRSRSSAAGRSFGLLELRVDLCSDCLLLLEFFVCGLDGQQFFSCSSLRALANSTLRSR